tara:strand:+ start:19465 stop:20049 length:585 start_codon:yes stop_codon:yes gene_type:complete
MQTLITMYAPIYRKPDGKMSYFLDGFYELQAAVHPNAPMKTVWQSLRAMEKSPVAVFYAGDKATFLLMDGDQKIQEMWNGKLQMEFKKVRGNRNHNGEWYMPFHSGIVFLDGGFIRSVPIQDMHQLFAENVPGIHMREHLRFEANRQRKKYQKLRDNVQFLDLFQGELLNCQRLEAGMLGLKRKRNWCVGEGAG